MRIEIILEKNEKFNNTILYNLCTCIDRCSVDALCIYLKTTEIDLTDEKQMYCENGLLKSLSMYSNLRPKAVPMPS